MKNISLDPAQLIFTRKTKLNTRVLDALYSLPRKDFRKRIRPIVVLKHPKKGRYLVYNGNHRGLVAKARKIKVNAILVKTDEDLANLPCSESMFDSCAKHYRVLNAARARLLKKSELFKKKTSKQFKNWLTRIRG